MDSKIKKTRKQRGSRTHGWGAGKKHRGAGSRGGRGMAGTGKRGKSRKQAVSGIKNYFGKYGFTTKRRQFVTSANIAYLENNGDYLLNTKKAELKEGFFVIDLKNIGIDKLISKGKPTRKYKITCFTSTKRAIDAVQAAGGEVLFSNQEGPEE
ncbi:MAG: uL15 family ribosomal protein [Nanoarchaeota archaeon]